MDNPAFLLGSSPSNLSVVINPIILDGLAEWLSRLTRNQLSFGGTGSNPVSILAYCL